MSEPRPTGSGVDAVEKAVEKVTHSPITSVLAIVLAVVGGALMGWSFLTGIGQAVKVPHPDSIWIALFFVGVGLDLVAIVLAIIGIVRRAHRVLSVVAVVLALVPGLVVLVIAALRYL